MWHDYLSQLIFHAVSTGIGGSSPKIVQKVMRKCASKEGGKCSKILVFDLICSEGAYSL